MMDYEIRIDIGALLHYSEVLKPQINNETLLMIIRSFSTYVRDLYKESIADAIFSPKYKGDWEPVEEEGYLEYIGTTPSADILDLMYDALEIREIKDNIIIRFDPEMKYPGSSRKLVQVLKAIDNGTSKFNSRPILKRLIRQFNRNLVTLWKGFLKKKGVA